MDQRRTNYFMSVAASTAKLSYAKRRQVGAVAVNQGKFILATGYNGTAPGEDNTCEGEDGATLPGVIHAEDNLIRQLQRGFGDLANTHQVFVTKEPCEACAELMVWHLPNLESVVYSEVSESKPGAGLSVLRLAGVATHQYVV